MNCKTCGLPVFHGAVGYAGPMCQCQWKSDAGYHIKQQEQLDLSDSAMTLLQTSIKNTQFFAEAEKLRAELAALKEELSEISAAIDDPACDLTHTAAECIKKLKAENESLRKDAELWRGYQKRKQDLLDRGFLRSPLRADELDAMAKGEQ